MQIAAGFTMMVKKTADKCIATLLLVAAIVWFFGIAPEVEPEIADDKINTSELNK